MIKISNKQCVKSNEEDKNTNFARVNKFVKYEAK